MILLDKPFNPGDLYADGPYTHAKYVGGRHTEGRFKHVKYCLGTVDKSGAFVPSSHPTVTEVFESADYAVFKANERAGAKSAATAAEEGLLRRLPGSVV